MNVSMENILETFNTADTWLDTETVAGLKNITARAVRISINKNPEKYNCKEVIARGGKAYLIQLSSLEEEYQIKYLQEYLGQIAYTNQLIQIKKCELKTEKIISEKQKNMALAKYDLVRFWEEFVKKQKENKISKHKANEIFLETYNTGLLYPNIFKYLNTVGVGSLYSWKKIIDENNNWTALVGKYNYSDSKTYRTKLSDNEKDIFLNLLLSPNKFSVGKAIGLTKYILKEKGYTVIPSDICFRRYAKWYKSTYFDKWTLARDGMKALKDTVEPYVLRDTSVLEVGQVLFADGHTLNFQVINPFTGKPARATLLGFFDWKSGGLVGYDIMMEECTQNIASALRNAILNMDKIPEYVYQDNGRAFKSKFFNGDTKFEELGFTGIYQKLGIKPIYAQLYNARAKVIERFFLDFQEGFEKLMPSYIGTSIENKPAYLNRNEKLHKQIHQEKANFIPTMQQALTFIQEWLKYKHSQPCPNDRTKTIQEMLDGIKKDNIDESMLDDLMMAQEVKHIGRNGIRFLKSDYFNDALYGIRTKAIIKYNLNDLSYIKVYTTKGEFMCRADRVTPTHPLAYQMGDIKDIEDYKQKIKKQTQLRNKTIKAIKEHFSLEDIDLIKNKLFEQEETNLVEPQKIEEKKILKKEKPQETYVNYRKRPVFNENFERYEWHMKNGCIGQEDRKWLSEYIKSEEYKQLYEN